MRRSVIAPFSIATSAARMRFCGMPKWRMPERMIHWFDEETAQTSQAERAGARSVRASQEKYWERLRREVCIAGLFHDLLAESAVHGDHFPAHDVFGDLPRSVVGVARAERAGDFFRHQTLFEFPAKKPSPASPDQSVPSQSNVAMRGLRRRTVR